MSLELSCFCLGHPWWGTSSSHSWTEHSSQHSLFYLLLLLALLSLQEVSARFLFIKLSLGWCAHCYHSQLTCIQTPSFFSKQLKAALNILLTSCIWGGKISSPDICLWTQWTPCSLCIRSGLCNSTSPLSVCFLCWLQVLFIPCHTESIFSTRCFVNLLFLRMLSWPVAP